MYTFKIYPGRLRQALVCLFIITSAVLPAASSTGDDPFDGRPRQSDGPYRILETWYHSLSLGMVANWAIDNMTIRSGVSVAYDILRFYFPLSSKTLFGIGINGTGHANYDSTVQLYLYLYSLSLQYYFQSIGTGFFLRADIGATRGAIFDDYAGTAGVSDWGLGYLAGVGYAIPISRETSLLLFVTYRSLNIESNTFSDLSFQVGWLL